MDGSPILLGTGASLAAGLATGLGALPVLGIRRPSRQQQNVLLGFAAGVMLAASFFSLILPAIEAAEHGGAGRIGAAATVTTAVLLGALCLSLLSRFAPVDHLVIGRAGVGADLLRRVWLFVAAITLHNFPEGLAVGVSFGDESLGTGPTTALGIGLQNMPEGLAVAVSLLPLGYSRARAAALALATGLVEPIGAFLGSAAVAASIALLPWGMGWAAGAMIYIVASEIIPEAHNGGQHVPATSALIIGLAAMMFLDVTLS